MKTQIYAIDSAFEVLNKEGVTFRKLNNAKDDLEALFAQADRYLGLLVKIHDRLMDQVMPDRPTAKKDNRGRNMMKSLQERIHDLRLEVVVFSEPIKDMFREIDVYWPGDEPLEGKPQVGAYWDVIFYVNRIYLIIREIRDQARGKLNELRGYRSFIRTSPEEVLISTEKWPKAFSQVRAIREEAYFWRSARAAMYAYRNGNGTDLGIHLESMHVYDPLRQKFVWPKELLAKLEAFEQVQPISA